MSKQGSQVVWPVVSATAHRELPEDPWPWLDNTLYEIVCWLRDEHGMEVGVSGMALGGDQAWARACHRAGLPFEAHMPFPQQADPWSPKQREEWRRLWTLAADRTYYAHHYIVGALHARNDGMLKRSDGIVAIWRPTVFTGGTWSCVDKAAAQGRTMYHLNPDTGERGWLRPDQVPIKTRHGIRPRPPKYVQETLL